MGQFRCPEDLARLIIDDRNPARFGAGVEFDA